MNANWLKANAYVVEHGKLVPRRRTPEQKRRNYRYVPYDCVNNPGPSDYFRETIARLQKENDGLRRELSAKAEEEAAWKDARGEAAEGRQWRTEVETLQQ
jgi:hypothetical protein